MTSLQQIEPDTHFNLSERARTVIHLDAMECLARHGGAPFSTLTHQGYGIDRFSAPEEAQASSFSRSHWSALLRDTLGAPLEHGHTIHRLKNGDDIFAAMLASIEAAVHSIDLLSFVFSEGRIARRFCKALIDRAEDGVRVQVLLDAVGGQALGNDLIDALKASPVDLRIFHPISNWKFWRTPSRNHRKILVIDDQVAYTGGVGIADEWLGQGDRPGHNRDTHFRITGPIVGQIKAAFLANRASAGGRLPYPANAMSRPSRKHRGTPAAVIEAPAASKFSRIALLFQLLARGAQDSLDIVTPYFVPGPRLVQELVDAAERGVKISIMISGQETDHLLPLWAGRRDYRRLLEAGVTIEEFDATLLHTKHLIVDQRLVVFGSPNVNQRSQSLDEELAVVAYDRLLAQQLLSDMQIDRLQCRQIDLERWKQRPLRMRLAETLALSLKSQI